MTDQPRVVMRHTATGQKHAFRAGHVAHQTRRGWAIAECDADPYADADPYGDVAHPDPDPVADGDPTSDEETD